MKNSKYNFAWVSVVKVLFKLILFIWLLLCIIYCVALATLSTNPPKPSNNTPQHWGCNLDKSHYSPVGKSSRDYALEEWSNYFNSEYICHVRHNLFRQKVLASLPFLVQLNPHSGLFGGLRIQRLGLPEKQN